MKLVHKTHMGNGVYSFMEHRDMNWILHNPLSTHYNGWYPHFKTDYVRVSIESWLSFEWW